MKQLTRKQMLEKRKRMNKEEVLDKSKTIQKKVICSKEFKNAKNVLAYIPINNEVMTDAIIKRAFVLGKKVSIPVVNGSRIVISSIDENEQLQPGKFNVPEPKQIKPVSQEKIDLAIIPGIAFDEDGNRVGYGKGYYDRLLAGMGAKKVALAYDFQIAKKILKEHNDIPMDIIMTEKRTGERISKSNQTKECDDK